MSGILPNGSERLSITAFFCHGIFSKSEKLDWLAGKVCQHARIGQCYNNDYKWKDSIVASGIKLAKEVVQATTPGSPVLLVGHSQGGLVCRVAAVVLMGEHLKMGVRLTESPRKLGIITIATPNAGALTYGQMSVMAEGLVKMIGESVELVAKVHNRKDLMTPRLFQDLENWRVNAKYLSISGVYVNRYSRGVARFADLLPVKRVSVRFDLPNDLVVEDSSTDLRQSLIRPEIDLTCNYRHVRAYPKSISLHHCNVHESDEVVNVILDNLEWLFT